MGIPCIRESGEHMVIHPDLYALVLRLRPARGQGTPTPQGHGAQALFLDLVRQADPALATQLHANASTKPFTVALLPQDPVWRREGILEVRAGFTRSDLFPVITRALLTMPGASTLRLGTVALELADVFGTPASHPWAGFSSFAELADHASPSSLLTLEFASPTAIGQGTREDGKTRLALLPT